MGFDSDNCSGLTTKSGSWSLGARLKERFISQTIRDAAGGYLGDAGGMNLSGPNPNNEPMIYQPDACFRPARDLMQYPQASRLVPYSDWVTVIVEVLHMQEWVQMYRQMPDVQYIFSIKMPADLRNWSYELYDVKLDLPPRPQLAARQSFDIRTVQMPHIIQNGCEACAWTRSRCLASARLPRDVRT